MIIWLVYPLIGILAGFMAGLFGIGGGLVIVPILTYVLVLGGIIPAEISPHVAIATSLVTVIFTSLSSAYAHYKQSTVNWELVKKMLPGIIVGAVLGPLIDSQISASGLAIIFGLFLMVMAVKIYLPSSSNTYPSLQRLHIIMPVSTCIGTLSSMLGIGGGGFIVPYLVSGGESIQKAIGTAAVTIFPMALVGVTTYILSGHYLANIDVAWMTGYIYWPAFAGIILTSVWFAPYGAKVAKRLSSHVLSRLFSVFLFIVAGVMLLRS